MSSRLRDTHSYESQIINAVRSVNKALGGTYGTSPAIHKSEFNQYEVQLIDAIKGIARTLSGSGLSLAGGVTADLSGYVQMPAFQALSSRVDRLEAESFFRLVDGNVTLKSDYSNLWVPGWLSAGGVGTGGGGGGSSYLKDLLDVYHDSSGILRGNGDPVETGDVLVYDDTTDPTDPRWIAAAVSASGTVTNYGDTTTGRIATVGAVDIYNGVKWGAAGTTANTFTLTINGTTKTVCLDGYGGGGGSVTGYIGTTQVQSTSQAQDITGILSINATSSSSSTSRIVWDATNTAWHFYGNIYADGWVSAGGVGGLGPAGNLEDLANVTVTSPSNGQALIYRNGIWNNETIQGGGSSTLAGLSDTSISSPQARQVLQYLSGSWTNTALYLGSSSLARSDLADVSITSTPTNGYVLTFESSSGMWKAKAPTGGGTGTVTSVGLTMPNIFSVSPATITSSGTFNVTLTNQTKNKVFASPSSSTGAPSFRSLAEADLPDLSGTYVTLSTTQNNISGAKTFTTNPVTIDSTSGLSVNASSYIDIGNARLAYDATAKALYVTKKPGTSNTIGFYSDGFVSAGGAAASVSRNIVYTDGTQTIGGSKTFSSALTLSSSLSVASTVTINGVTLTGSSSKLSVSKNTEFSGLSGTKMPSSGKITISEIVERIYDLEH